MAQDPQINQLMSVVADSARPNAERQAAYDMIEQAIGTDERHLEDAGVTKSWRADALAGLRQDPSRVDPETGEAPDAPAEDPASVTRYADYTAGRSVVDGPSTEELMGGEAGRASTRAASEADRIMPGAPTAPPVGEEATVEPAIKAQPTA
jgi:hypothetical protein